MVAVMDLMIRKRLEDTRSLFMKYSRKMVFDSPMSPNLHMPHKIEIMMDDLIDPMRRQSHIDDGLPEIVQRMIQLQMTLHME